MIGLKCKKKSKRGTEPRPFKNGNKFSTIKGLAINPHTGNYAFEFEDCVSIIDFNSIVILDDKYQEIDKADLARQKMVHANRIKKPNI